MKKTRTIQFIILILTLAGCQGIHSGATAATFTEVTEATGLNNHSAFRICAVDIDLDGYPDLLLHEKSDETAEDVTGKQVLLMNRPGDDPGDPYSRKFVDVTEESGIRTNRDGTENGRHSSSCILADVDNDGDMDIFMVVYVHRNYDLHISTNDLLLNDGTGRFTPAADSPFHVEPVYNTACEIFLDFNNDGNLDIFIGNWYFNDVLSQDHLYMGHGDGSFTRVTGSAGLEDALSAVYACAAGDYNSDGYPDIFVPSYSHTAPGAVPYLWRNNGDGTFTAVQEETNYDDYGGYQSDRASFGSMPFDYDNDGDIDFFEIFTHGRGDGDGYYHSTVVTNTDNVFSWDFFRVDGRRDEDPMWLHHGDHFASWFDYDNDGLYDFVLTESGYDNNRLYLFKQDEDHTFRPVTNQSSGLIPVNAEGLAVGNATPLDYDRDGDEDLVLGIDGSNMRLYRNNVGTENNRLTVTLQGAGTEGYSNRSAVGARVRVTAGGRTLTRELYAGNGHQGPQTPMQLGFGLGNAEKIDDLTVRWPNENLTEIHYNDIPVNAFPVITEPVFTDMPDIGVRLTMPSDFFTPGDECRLDAYTFNSGEPMSDVPVFVLLAFAGEYWFWDAWSQDMDYRLMDIGSGIHHHSIIPPFTWPDTGSDSVAGFQFMGCMLNEEMTSILGDMDGLGVFEFGFGEE